MAPEFFGMAHRPEIAEDKLVTWAHLAKSFKLSFGKSLVAIPAVSGPLEHGEMSPWRILYLVEKAVKRCTRLLPLN